MATSFQAKGKDKVYIFKMLVDGSGSGMDVVKRMQPGGDLENAWLMFDHVKHVQEWIQWHVTCTMQGQDYRCITRS
jgi:hypothetical protein